MKARFFIAMFLLVGLVAVSAPNASAQPAPATGDLIFEITGSGKLYHFESVVFGSKPAVTTVNSAAIVSCIVGNANCIDGVTIDTDAGGKAYLIIQDLTTAFITTHTNCTDFTVLSGLVGGNGAFMFSGTHALSNTQLIAQGKVKFLRSPPNPQFIPVSIAGATIKAVSEDHLHYGIGTFKTVGVPTTCP